MRNAKMKLLSLTMILVLALGCFTACGDGKNKENETKAPTNNTDGGQSDKYKDMNAIEFTKVMGNGINLGNTMEAYGHSAYGIDAATSVYETSWSMPVTTKEMIQGMKDAGFDSLRVPVSWTNMMDFENGDYTINQKYIDRVGEIIDYAMAADMIVLINDHWDGGWWGMFGSATEATREKAMNLYVEMWTQIAKAYKDYDCRLVFESGNEEMGNRFNDNTEAWNKDSGTLSEDECYELTNKLNQKFVDIVREAGGNNADRFLLLAGYNTNIADTCDDRYKMPTDKAKDKLMVSVHYYDPSAYCINDGISTWGSKTDVEAMNDTLKTLTKFTDAGYGVIIGEYGVLIEGKNELKKNTLDYFKNFIANCDKYGYCPVLWDCNSIYNRNECKIGFDEIASFFKEKSYSQAQKDMKDEDIVAAADKVMEEALAAAPTGEVVPDTEARAWIMFNSGDWGIAYRVGDDYPDGQAEGLVATDVKVDGEGKYTVGLDFTGTANGCATNTAFSALGILHGEDLFPGYYIDITEIRINGEKYEMTGKGYTTSDDKSCTRVNLYNEWVKKVPEEARVSDGDLTGCSSMIVDGKNLGDIKTLEIDFTYVAP